MYEILFEGAFDQKILEAGGAGTDVEGFFALRHVDAESMKDAISLAFANIKYELRSYDEKLEEALLSIDVVEYRQIGKSDSKYLKGFTFF